MVTLEQTCIAWNVGQIRYAILSVFITVEWMEKKEFIHELGSN